MPRLAQITIKYVYFDILIQSKNVQRIIFYLLVLFTKFLVLLIINLTFQKRRSVNQMKARGVPQFTSKLSQQLSKFKDSSTLNIAHEQIRKLFGQYSFAEIVIQFTSKMDSCDRLSDREKKQYAKLYISLIDAYGAEVLYQQYYQRIMQSLSKKTIGVGEVIGHLCKSLLSRIHPPQNTLDYISYILTLFRNHCDVCKIIRNMMQSIDAAICVHFQHELIAIINEKINNKSKIQAIEALLAVILSLQDNFQYEQIAHSLISKNYKNQDYNVRKTCVDICYALLVVREETNPLMHRIVKELKYDKIKHVRDAVANYFALYKQLFGQQQEKKPVSTKNAVTNDFDATKRGNKPAFQNNVLFSPMNTTQRKATNQRNETFFKNAKNSHVIKTSEDNNKSAILLGQQRQNREKENFQNDGQQQKEDFQEQRQDARIDSIQQKYQNQAHQNLREHQGTNSKFPKDFQQYLKKRQYPTARQQKADQVRKNQKFNFPEVQIFENKSKKAHFNIQSKLVLNSQQDGVKQQLANNIQSSTQIKKVKKFKTDNQNFDRNIQKKTINLPNPNYSPKQDIFEQANYHKKVSQQQIKEMNLAQMILGMKNIMFQKLQKIEKKVNNIADRVSHIQQKMLEKQRDQRQGRQKYQVKKVKINGFQRKQNIAQEFQNLNQSQIKHSYSDGRFVQQTSPFEGSYEIGNSQSQDTIVQQLNGFKSSDR